MTAVAQVLRVGGSEAEMARTRSIILMAVAAMAASGCTTTGGDGSARRSFAAPPARLVLAPRLRAVEPGPETNRNDRLLGAPPWAGDPLISVGEVHVHERLYITSGRPREHTSITTHSYRRVR